MACLPNAKMWYLYQTLMAPVTDPRLNFGIPLELLLNGTQKYVVFNNKMWANGCRSAVQ